MAKKDTSPNKIEANRRNAKKSTGPRSAAGKAKSSRNAVKHGLLAERIVLADHKDEDPQQFGLLLDGLREDYQPQSTIETMLVERLAASFWRLRRAYRFEVEAITHANLPNPLADALDELSHLQPVPRGECILPPLHSLGCLIRYETMIDRELLRTLRQLELRQRLRKIEQAPDHPDGASHWQQAASGTPAQAPQAQGKQHGQEYLPMPPERSVRGRSVPGRSVPRSCRPCAGNPKQGSQSRGTLPRGRAKAPAPNEPTAMPNAGHTTCCERRSMDRSETPELFLGTRPAIKQGGQPALGNSESHSSIGWGSIVP